MAKGKWIDKKNATHFQLVYRPQNDPLIHDENAPGMVLNPIQTPEQSASTNPQQHVGKTLGDLSSLLGSAAHVRENEGEAANHGIYYDDSEYDYMQHMRELGTGAGEAVFIEANKPDANKGKKKMNLEDAIRQMSIGESQKPVDKLDESILPSQNLQPISYQNQQNVPDSIAGFQPDMDPRLREVLEALEDDAYVDSEDDDLFQDLTKGAEELDEYEFDETYDEDFGENDGYESDGTAKPTQEYRDGAGPAIKNDEEDDEVPELVSVDENGEVIPPAASSDWMEDFKQFKKDQKDKKKTVTFQPSEMQASTWTATTNGGNRKRRKGALSTPSMTSMSSSVLVRTEQLELLDRRFEVLQNKEFQNWDGIDDNVSMSEMSAMSSVSTVQGDVRQDFDDILDEFLGGHEVRPRGTNKKQQRKMRQQDGVARLDELRRGLGPAHLRGRN
ncbi:Protein LTV1 [Ceratocystis fimbriata CBS 114723]|uniref:Protein LTV1 n=2 Tax=Ceratocystis TaxID=5157 RepID=A0A2C5X2J0_9PEZI|nr:Protein LTV1 [Ceratocystis fimbriata CBS 114723]